MKTWFLVTAVMVLAGCGEANFVGNIGDPYCAPDGSVVYGIYPNSQGQYAPIRSNRENCPWHKK